MIFYQQPFQASLNNNAYLQLTSKFPFFFFFFLKKALNRIDLKQVNQLRNLGSNVTDGVTCGILFVCHAVLYCFTVATWNEVLHFFLTTFFYTFLTPF